MAITYPLTFPTGIAVASLGWEPRNAAYLGESPFTFQQAPVIFPGQAWAVTLEIPLEAIAEGRDFEGFLLALNGTQGTFLYGNPLAVTPRGVISGNPKVEGPSTALPRTLCLNGLPVSTPNIVRRGDHLQIGSGADTRLYMVLETAGSSSSGKAVFAVWPNLRAVPAHDTPVTYTNPKGIWRLRSGINPYQVNAPFTHSFSLDIVEAV